MVIQSLFVIFKVSSFILERAPLFSLYLFDLLHPEHEKSVVLLTRLHKVIHDLWVKKGGGLLLSLAQALSPPLALDSLDTCMALEITFKPFKVN